MTSPEISDDLRFPVGKFDKTTIGSDTRAASIKAIVELPASIAKAVEGLTDEQLDTPYRPGGWTVRQTVHHVADSHLNAYLRVRLALTEDWPTVKAYNEKTWAE